MTGTAARDTAPTAFWWREAGDESPPHDPCRTGPSWTVVGPGNFRETTAHSPVTYLHGGAPPEWSDDLFRAARAVFLADKHVPRKDTEDGWTRTVHVSVPVHDPDRWHAGVRARLTALLETLTGDRWEIICRPLTREHTQLGIQFFESVEVTLFSGGLDSLSWAAQRAAEPSATPLFLVQFGERNLADVQDSALRALASRRHVFPRETTLVEHSQNIERGAGSGKEHSSRTRGFLYATAAIRVAAAHGSRTVHIPENGQVALNPPLNASRAGACSTRSVHPWTLWQLNGLVADLKGDSELTVVNPFALHTKGEVCGKGIAAGLRRKDLHQTLSCGHSPRRQVGGDQRANCGSCFPCLLRRSGLHATGPDATDYARVPWSEAAKPAHTSDWRALRRWVGRHRPYEARDLIADMPFPPGMDLAASVALVNRGRAELRKWMASVTA